MAREPGGGVLINYLQVYWVHTLVQPPRDIFFIVPKCQSFSIPGIIKAKGIVFGTQIKGIFLVPRITKGVFSGGQNNQGYGFTS